MPVKFKRVDYMQTLLKDAKCKICGDSRKTESYALRDCTFGQEGEFTYFQCKDCGSLQIEEIPGNLSFYQSPEELTKARPRIHRNPIKRFRRQRQCKKALNSETDLGTITTDRRLPERLIWMSEANVRIESRVLDLFSGSGRLLMHLHRDGLRNLTGTDSRLSETIQHPNGVTVFNKRLDQMEGKYDFIMMHHFLQRLHDQEESLKHVRRLLSDDGRVLIRMPLVDSFAFRTYGPDWVQINAPRNVVLHSRKSMEVLCEKVGFAVTKVRCDSTEFQFYGSEQYRYGICSRSPESWLMDPEKSIFDQPIIDDYRSRALELNQAQDGDQACFYLEPR